MWFSLKLRFQAKYMDFRCPRAPEIPPKSALKSIKIRENRELASDNKNLSCQMIFRPYLEDHLEVLVVEVLF